MAGALPVCVLTYCYLIAVMLVFTSSTIRNNGLGWLINTRFIHVVMANTAEMVKINGHSAIASTYPSNINQKMFNFSKYLDHCVFNVLTICIVVHYHT